MFSLTPKFSSIPKILIIISILVAIAVIHVVRLGQYLQGQAYNLYYSYFSDFIIPFGMYFLISLYDATIPFLNKWYVKAGLIFALTTLAEICQFFGIGVLGVTFDPFDILTYGLGVCAAAFIDVKIFSKYLVFWVVPMEIKMDQAGKHRA